MTSRDLLHQQIDSLPDDIVEEIADFTLFVMARRQIELHLCGLGSSGMESVRA